MFLRIGHRTVVALVALGCAFAIAAQAPPPTSTLSVSGNVAQPLTLTIDDLRRYPAHRVEYTPRGGMSGSTAAEPARHYTGCLLRDVLSAAKPTEAKARDLRKSYVVVFSWAELFISSVGDSVFVVYERDGAPLPDDEGRIALVAVTDLRPARHVKWLRTLALRTAQ
jgi:DMSO/TMAO reductase YedYZ molybdopterin-dependent catalytic subunit